MPKKVVRCQGPSYEALLHGTLQTQLDGSVRGIRGYARQHNTRDHIVAHSDMSILPATHPVDQGEELSTETVIKELKDGSQYVQMSICKVESDGEEPELVVFTRHEDGTVDSQVRPDPASKRSIPGEILLRCQLGTMLIEAAMMGRDHVDAIVIDPRSNGAATRASILVRPYNGAMLSTYRTRAWEFEYEHFSLDDPNTVVVRELEVITAEVVPLFSSMDWEDGSFSLQYTVKATRRLS